jgi:hypothetical protein
MPPPLCECSSDGSPRPLLLQPRRIPIVRLKPDLLRGCGGIVRLKPDLLRGCGGIVRLKPDLLNFFELHKHFTYRSWAGRPLSVMGIDVDGETAGESGNTDTGKSRSETCDAAAECSDAESLVFAPVEGGPPESPEQTVTGKENTDGDADAAADPVAISLDSLIEIALQNLDGD